LYDTISAIPRITMTATITMMMTDSIPLLPSVGDAQMPTLRVRGS
jgi:hypothetical protein